MQIIHRAGKGFFALSEEGKQIGELLYVELEEGKQLRFDHTIVDEDQEGKGIGKALVAFGVAHARGHGQRIIPACPYVAVLFKRHPEMYTDVVAG